MANHTSTPLHHYQRGILFSFIISLAIFVLYVAAAPRQLSSSALEMYSGMAWIVAYTAYGLWLRSRIPDQAWVDGLQRPILHWVLLGIAIVYFNVVKPSDFQFLYPIINFGFIVFTLFSADAHWDFRR